MVSGLELKRRFAIRAALGAACAFSAGAISEGKDS